MDDDEVVELARWRASRDVNPGDEAADEVPLLRLARGRAGAAEACVDAYGPLIQGLARRLLPSGADVEDVVQEVLVELWRAADRFDPSRASDRGFVAMLTRRRVVDRRRRAERRPRLVALDADVRHPSGDEHERIVGRLAAVPAVEALEALPEERRSWIVMAVVEGFSHSEIATKTGRPLGTVKSGIRRGLTQMRRWLEQREASEVGP